MEKVDWGGELSPEKERERNDALKALTRSVGWAILRQAAEVQCTIREQQVLLRPVAPDWLVTQQEFAKGEAAGIRLFLALPGQMIEADEEMKEENDGNSDN